MLRSRSSGRAVVLATYAAGLLIVTLAPLPGAAYDVAAAGSDKLVHFVLFAGLAVVTYWAFGLRRWLAAAGIAVAAAALIEVAQTPLAYRSGDPWDFVWGAVGAVVTGTIALSPRRTGSAVPPPDGQGPPPRSG